MSGFSKSSNCQAMKETKMVVVNFCSIFIFLQTNDVSVVFNIIRKVRGVSKWVCGHDELNSKTDKVFNDPFRVGTLILEVRWKILRG